MEFRILGPLEVVDNGRQLELGGAKQRALLAMLLLNANEVVSTDRLTEAIWEHDAPSRRKTLQVYVSQLRKTLGRARLETKEPGYRLRVEPDELDAARFERLVEEHEPREALALWRGGALCEFTYQRFAQAEITRLEDLRLASLEKRIDADLAAGRHAELVGELEALVDEHPLRERLREQLMLALYRTGRQGEALEAYRRARTLLVEELGIEPRRSLRELHRSILEQQPVLDLDVDTAEARESPSEPRSALAIVKPPPTHSPSERKTVTVLHVRVGLAPQHANHVDPEVMRSVTTRMFGQIAAAIEAHEGTIEAVGGDSVSGIFGLPLIHEDDALRAVRAAEDVRSRLAAHESDDEPLVGVELRTGVSTGEVITGDTTGPYDRATGEPLTESSRLAQQAEPGEIRLDAATRKAVDAARGNQRRFASPMVGRARERRRLHDALEQSIGDRSCQMFTILGVAGVGKSRLAQEFLDDLAGRALVARGRCLPYGDGITFWPILEAIRDVAEIPDTASLDEARARLASLLADDDSPEVVAQRVIEAIGLAEAQASVEEGFGALRRVFEALGDQHPVVVLFDDIHWGEPTFHDLVEYLADWSRGASILLLCLARPELLEVRPAWGGGKLNATTVLLEPLSEHECAQLVANLLGQVQLAEEVKARIAEAAEGNPLFVEEMLSMLIDDGVLTRGEDGWALTGDLGAVPIPATIHALLASRLDRLTVSEKAVIERAAVEGKIFHRASVEALSSASERTSVGQHVGALVRKELVRPDRPVFAGEDAYRFRHLLIRDAAYEVIPKELRAELHEGHAAWLEEKAGDRAVEYDEIIGYHLEQAFRYHAELGRVSEHVRETGRRAAVRLGTAGRRAFLRSDAPAGANLISRAVGLLTADDPLRVELVPNVRVIQGMTDLSWADRVLTEAVEAAATTGDRGMAAQALVQRGLLRLFTDPEVTPQELFEVSERAIGVFEELDDSLGLARAWRLVAQSNYLDRRLGACAEASERALEHARRYGDRFEEREIIEWLVIALLLGPSPAPDATGRCEGLLDETRGDPQLQAQILSALAHLRAMQGELTTALALTGRSKRLMDEVGEWNWIAAFWWAFVHVWQGDPVTAENVLRPGYDALKRMGEKSHFSSITHGLSTALYLQGRYDEAEKLTLECENACRANDVHSQILWRSIRAKVLARRGQFEQAEGLAREAIELAETSDFLQAHGDAQADLAEVLALAGRTEDAKSALEDAVQLYERKRNVMAPQAARSRIAELT